MNASPGRLHRGALVAGALVLGACTAHYPVNEPVDSLSGDEAYQLSHQEGEARSDELLLILTFSGGGTRAAALSYGVLEALAETTIRIDGRERRLLDEVDIISSVSGGSFTAAYYGLFGDRIFEDFEEKFLNRNVQWELEKRLISPTQWFKLGSSHYDRSDMAADYYDELLFEGKTFRDIFETDGPLVAINATDIGLGAQFTFIGSQFAPICSDIMSFPVSRAVTASSAVPGAFSSIVIKNYAGTCGYELPEWASQALDGHDITSRQFHQARRLAAYLDAGERPYLQLCDGGVSDNLGVRPLLDVVYTEGDIWNKLEALDLDATRKLAIIVVNAQTASETSIEQSDEATSIFETVKLVSSIPLAQYSFETLQLLRSSIGEWERAIAEGRCEEAGGTGGCMARTYLVEVSFQAVRDVPRWKHLLGLPTSFDLEDDDVELLRDTARHVLDESEPFRDLVRDLGG